MHIETGLFVISCLVGFVCAGVLYWLGRKAYFMYRFTVARFIGCAIAFSLAVYYILHVVIGSGRTGWP